MVTWRPRKVLETNKQNTLIWKLSNFSWKRKSPPPVAVCWLRGQKGLASTHLSWALAALLLPPSVRPRLQLWSCILPPTHAPASFVPTLPGGRPGQKHQQDLQNSPPAFGDLQSSQATRTGVYWTLDFPQDSLCGTRTLCKSQWWQLTYHPLSQVFT